MRVLNRLTPRVVLVRDLEIVVTFKPIRVDLLWLLDVMALIDVLLAQEFTFLLRCIRMESIGNGGCRWLDANPGSGLPRVASWTLGSFLNLFEGVQGILGVVLDGHYAVEEFFFAEFCIGVEVEAADDGDEQGVGCVDSALGQVATESRWIDEFQVAVVDLAPQKFQLKVVWDC